MKVLIVNTSDIEGGAARAAYRLHNSLLEQGIDSNILCNYKSSDDSTVTSVTTNFKKKVFAKIASFRDRQLVKNYPQKTASLFSPSKYSSGDALKYINQINPDIVHIHWINHGMLTIKDISKIKAPIVWSMHDMWLFTGGCHYDEECGRFTSNCYCCKVLRSSKKNDLSSDVYRKKIKHISSIKDFTVVGLSSWLTKAAKSSLILRDRNVINLPNPINISRFKPIDKKVCRDLWNLPKDKKLVLFGAMGATSDPRKGFKELSEAINKMDCTNKEFVVFGSSKPKDAPEMGGVIHYVGMLTDYISLITLYSSVDVMVVPSLQENLSNAIMESLSCGTPVAGFDIGGNKDMIDHGKNGYLAKPFDTSDLAFGIEWILSNNDLVKLSYNARRKVVREFDSKIVAKRYIDLYEKVLNN